MFFRKILAFDNPWGEDENGENKKPSNSGKNTQNPNIVDLEQTIEDYKKKFKDFFGEGRGKKSGGKGKKPPMNGVVLVILILPLLWLLSGFYTVQVDEQALILRFGAYHRAAEPGIHYHLPTPIEKLYKVKVTKINSVEIGYRSGSSSNYHTEESLMLTGDENIVDINFEVQWKVREEKAKNFLFNVRDNYIGATVKSASESAMREVIGKTKIALALAEGKRDIEAETKKLLQKILDSYQIGIEVVRLQLLKVDPPSQVIDSFRDVQTAKLDKERAINQAESYRNDILPKARGEAQKIIEDSKAYKEKTVADALGRASRFRQVYKEYSKAKIVTRKRLYLNTMEEILSKAEVTILDSKASKTGVLPYLPLNKK